MSAYRTEPMTLAEVLGHFDAIVDIVGRSSEHRVHVVIDGVTVLNEEPGKARGADAASAFSAAAGLNSLTYQVQLHLAQSRGTLIYEHVGAEQYATLNVNHQQLNKDHFMQLLRETVTRVPPFNRAVAVGTHVGAGVEAAINAMYLRAAHTQELLDKNLVDSHALQRDMEAHHTERLKQLDAAHAARLHALENDFQQRKTALDERAAAMDAVDARAARRRAVKDLADQLQKQATAFELTRQTIGKRWPIVWACLLAGLASVGAFVVTLKADGAEAYVPRGAAALAFFGTIWFFIRWNDDWFTKHADGEFRLKQMQLDTIRASWLVELAAEWQEQKVEMPKELLAPLSRGLFESDDVTRVRTPPEEAIAALLGVGAEVEGQAGGVKFKLDRKAAKDAAKLE